MPKPKRQTKLILRRFVFPGKKLDHWTWATGPNDNMWLHKDGELWKARSQDEEPPIWLRVAGDIAMALEEAVAWTVGYEAGLKAAR